MDNLNRAFRVVLEYYNYLLRNESKFILKKWSLREFPELRLKNDEDFKVTITDKANSIVIKYHPEEYFREKEILDKEIPLDDFDEYHLIQCIKEFSSLVKVTKK